MNSMELVRFPSRSVRPPQGPAKKSPPPFSSELIGPVRNAIVRARHALVTSQRSDGSWLGRSADNVSLASQLVFLLTYLERDEADLAHQCGATILSEQRPNGGWSVTPHGETDISASVQAYLALKLTGHDPTDDSMIAARETIRKLGGADAADSATRLFLALLGQLSYDHCSPMLAETSHLEASLSIVQSRRPVRKVPIERGVRELFVKQPCDWPANCGGDNPVSNNSQVLNAMEPARMPQLSLSELVWHIVALQAIGDQTRAPELSACEASLYEFVDIDEELGCAYPRAGTGPDSALAIRSLLESGTSPNHPAIKEGLDYLCQSATATFPRSVTDTCNVFNSLTRSLRSEIESDSALPPDMDVRWDWRYNNDAADQEIEDWSEATDGAPAQLVDELLNDQNLDGGWSDAANVGPAYVSEPAATGAALESLATSGGEKVETSLNRGCEFLRSVQLGDGGWSKSDGSQQVECTSASLRGLLATGVSPDDDSIAAAVNWLVIHQQPNGAWDASVSQTAHAILGLVAAGEFEHPAVRRGIKFLLDSQSDEGDWSDESLALHDHASEHQYRGDLHSTCRALSALSRFAVAAGASQPAASNKLSLRIIASSAEI